MTKKSNILDTVVQNGYSVRSGVYSLVDNRIKIRLNEFGEYEYAFDKSITEHELSEVAKVCAMSDSSPDETEVGKELFAGTEGIKHQPLIGYYNGLFAGHVTEGSFRENASSGGFTSWILKELLERKLVDGVIHVVETPDKDAMFSYGVSRTAKDIRNGSKSRYYPAEFSEVISKVRNTGGRYAIVGIPSFIMEIRLLARRDPEIKKMIKYTLGLVCGHQKSTKYAECLAWQCGIKPGTPFSIDFRKKVEGIDAKKYATEVTGKINGKNTTVIKQADGLLGGHWGHGFFKTKLSDYTDDIFNETADVTMGDAWLPKYTEDGLGNNMIIVRNKDILKIIKEGIKNKKVKADEITPADCMKSQPGLIHHAIDDLPYRLYKRDKKHEWRPKKRLKASKNIPIMRRKMQDIREDIARQSHIAYKRAVELNDWTYFEKSMNPLLRKYKLMYALMGLKRYGPVWLIRKLMKG